ncbi:MAG: adenosine kinase [Pelagibacterales bacterium]|nr:adenosine kinase [Pelagibacterales bacterium]
MTKKIIGIGNAIVDILCKVDDDFLIKNNLIKASMSLIDEDIAKKLSKLDSEKITSGGSAGNTMAILGQMDCKSEFLGKVANDEFGQKFISQLSSSKTKFINNSFSNKSSAKSFILVTPDAQRTMCTFLGCASEIDETDINEEIFKNTSVLYLEGYLWDREKTINSLKKSIELAKKNNVKVAFSLSDVFCVARHKKDFLALVKNDLDILFANEDEILELVSSAEFSMTEIAEFLKQKKDLIGVITRSEKGCAVFQNNKFFETKANQIDNLIDTTGAGDAFAAGFLYALSNDLPLKKAAEIGNILASKIIQKLGARFDDEEIVLISQNIKN